MGVVLAALPCFAAAQAFGVAAAARPRRHRAMACVKAAPRAHAFAAVHACARGASSEDDALLPPVPRERRPDAYGSISTPRDEESGEIHFSPPPRGPGTNHRNHGDNNEDEDNNENHKSILTNILHIFTTIMKLLVNTPAKLLAWYLSLLSQSPLYTKMITAAFLGACSDIIAQHIEQRIDIAIFSHPIIDYRRMFSLAIVGMFLTAPMFHVLYNVLENLIPVSTMSGWYAFRNTSLQLFIDQVIAAPVWLLAFYTMFATIENGTFNPHDIMQQIDRDFVKSMKLTWTVFPIFQIFSFALLPLHMRVLVLNVVDLGYTAALSLLQHS